MNIKPRIKPLQESLKSSDDADIKAVVRLALFEESMKQKFIPETNGECMFDSTKVKEYLRRISLVNKDLSDEVADLLDRTQYISMDELVIHLNKAMDLFEKSIGDEPFVIITTRDKGYSSEEYMIQLLWHRLRKLNVRGIYHYQDDIPHSTVVWIDDVSYSGGNISEALSAQVKNENIKDIHIILAAMSDVSLEVIDFMEKYPIKLHLHYGLSIPGFKQGDSLIPQYFWHSSTLPPVYLDYKVASAQSTYSYIYMNGLVPEKCLSDEDILDFDPSTNTLPGEKMGPLMKTIPSRKVITALWECHQAL